MRNKFLIAIILSIAIIWLHGCTTERDGYKQNMKEPMLVTLCTADRTLCCLNVKDFRVIHRIKLRSLCLDFAKGEDGKIYTSQCGLAGSDADNVIGIVDARKGFVDRYYELKNPNPGEITYGKGKIVVINGMLLNSKYMPGEIIDSNLSNRSESIQIPGITYGPSLSLNQGQIYVSIQGLDPSSKKSFISMDLNTKKVRTIFDNQYFMSVAFDGAGIGYGLVPRDMASKHGKDYIIAFDPTKKTLIEKISLERQSMPADAVVYFKGKIYVNFFNDENLEYTGDSVGILDLTTKRMQVLKGFKGPSAVLPIEDRIYITNNDAGTIDMLDMSTYKTLSSIAVGKWPSGIAYINN